MAFLVGGANSLTAAYDIENSLRFDGESAELTREQDSGNRKTWTCSFWLKDNGSTSKKPFWGTPSEGEHFFMLNNKLYFQHEGSSGSNLNTVRLLRDPSAWYHLVIASDTTQGTAANRLKLYINGSQYTWDDATTYPDEDSEFKICQDGENFRINAGHANVASGGSQIYMADFAFVDGTAYAASNFGETDGDSGIWKPKKPSVTWGTNGFFLEFKQSGTDQDASGMGADTSGNGLHFAVTDLTSVDQTTDTPTNNFCTLNPLVPRHANFTFDEGNCGILVGHDNNFVWGTMPGKMDSSDVGWYFELRLGAAPVGASGYGLGVGVGDFDYAVGVADTDEDGGWSMHADTAKMIGTNYAYDPNYTLQDNGGGNKIDLGVDTNVGEIIQVAWKDSKVFLGVNNTYYATDTGTDGDPANGDNPSHTISSTYEGDNWMPILNSSLAGASLSKFNFGNPPFSISSGNADANGYGNFEYAPPSGFYALCSKNLAEFGG